jgi:hypothetical protein
VPKDSLLRADDRRGVVPGFCLPERSRKTERHKYSGMTVARVVPLIVSQPECFEIFGFRQFDWRPNHPGRGETDPELFSRRSQAILRLKALAVSLRRVNGRVLRNILRNRQSVKS